MKLIYRENLSQILRRDAKLLSGEAKEDALQLAARVSHPSFIGRLHRRNQARREQEELIPPTGQVKYRHLSPEEKRRYHDAYDEASLANKELGEMKDIHAQLAQRMFPEPEERPIAYPAKLRLTGEAPSGSAEWLRMRQPTLGGSDVGAIMRADPVWGEMNYTRVRESKIDIDPQTQEHSGAAARGDMWEPVLLRSVEYALGETVFINKGTVTDGKRHANLDGFIPAPDGSVDAIVECKTSSFPDEWGEDEIPPGYVLQVEHYASMYQARRAYLVVNIDDVEIRVYEFDKLGFETVKLTDGMRKSLGLGKSQAVYSHTLHPYIGYWEDGSQPAEFTYSQLVDRAIKYVKDWNKIRVRHAEMGKPTRGARTFSDWEESWSHAFDKGYVWLDLETSYLTEAKGFIIELAAIRDDGEELEELYSPSKTHLAWNGTGEVDVHHITPEDVEGKPVLIYDEDAQKRVRDFIGDRAVIAHNKLFEERWLREILGPDQVYCDTMHLFSNVDKKQENGLSMSALMEYAGMEYKDAHRAMPDVRMMKAAAEKVLLPYARKEVKKWRKRQEKIKQATRCGLHTDALTYDEDFSDWDDGRAIDFD